MNKPTLIILTFLIAPGVFAGELFGTVEAVSGEATIIDPSGSTHNIKTGLQIFSGQSIQTSADGEVHIVTEDSGLIALRPNSSFRVDQYQAKGESSDNIVFSLFKGAMRSITGWIAKRNSSAYRLNTPSGTIGVRGTDHETTVLEKAADNDLPGTFDTVNEGKTYMFNDRGEVEIHPGEFAFSSREEGSVPKLLAQHPNFMKRRILKIENRIQKRKENLKKIIQRRIDDKGGAEHDPSNGINAIDGKPREVIKSRIIKRRRIIHPLQ